MYSIIEFDNGIFAIPTIWLSEDKRRFKWPPYNNKTILKAVSEREQPDENWEFLDVVKIFGTAHDYDSAMKKVSLAEQLTNINNKENAKKTGRHLAQCILSNEILNNEARPPQIKFKKIESNTKRAIGSNICPEFIPPALNVTKSILTGIKNNDSKIIWKNYTDRHKRRLADKQSLGEFKEIYKKVKANNIAYNIVSESEKDDGDNKMDLSCNFSHTDRKNIVTLHTGNIINNVPTEDCESKSETSNYKYSTNEEWRKEKTDIENVINDRRNIENNEIISDTSNELIEKNNFKSEIKQWAMDYKICLNALTNLLEILNKRTSTTFPTDGRTLMETPKVINVIAMDKGSYCHFGVEPAINEMIQDRISLKIDDLTINLMVSTDGATISASSGKTIWPIFCSDKLLPKVRVIGIYYGHNKPADSNKFLEAFVNELILLINNGVIYNERSYKIRLHALICDAPAKAFVLKIKNHTGYDSCTKCVIHGNRIDDTNCFPIENINPPLRYDEVFRDFGYSDNYQINKTILINVPFFGPVTNTPLDYMHLVCLGIMRKLLFLWMKGPLNTRLSNLTIQQISKKLLSLNKYTPFDFPRKQRSLEFIKLWKATEFRQFLLYSGPVILQNILHKNVYEHFLTLHIAIRILANTEYSKKPQLLQYAEELLNIFVKSFSTIYGAKYVSHNVHNLLHLTNDVKQFGALDVFSAFQFESYICSLKRLVRKGDKPLEQIAKRLYELNFCTSRSEVRSKTFILKKNHKDGPLDNEQDYKEEYKILHLDVFYLNCEDNKNNCVILKDNIIVYVLNIAKNQNDNLYIIGKKLIPCTNLFETPCESRHFGIVITKLNISIESWFCKNNICAKAYIIPYKDKFIILPILHTIVPYETQQK